MFVRTKRKLFVTQKDNRSINADLGALGVCVFFCRGVFDIYTLFIIFREAGVCVCLLF